MAEGPRERRDAFVSGNSATGPGPIVGDVILTLAIFIQYRSVTDTHTHTHKHRQTDGQTDTRRRHVA